MNQRQPHQRFITALFGTWLVLAFAAFGQINMLDNLQHVTAKGHHQHSALSLATMASDHAQPGGHHDSGDNPATPGSSPEHAHPNILGNLLTSDEVRLVAHTVYMSPLRMTPPRDAFVVGHIQQTPDRPPKHSA